MGSEHPRQNNRKGWAAGLRIHEALVFDHARLCNGKIALRPIHRIESEVVDLSAEWRRDEPKPPFSYRGNSLLRDISEFARADSAHVVRDIRAGEDEVASGLGGREVRTSRAIAEQAAPDPRPERSRVPVYLSRKPISRVS